MWFFAAWCYFWGAAFTVAFLNEKLPKTPKVDAFCAIIWPVFIPASMIFMTFRHGK